MEKERKAITIVSFALERIKIHPHLSLKAAVQEVKEAWKEAEKK